MPVSQRIILVLVWLCASHIMHATSSALGIHDSSWSPLNETQLLRLNTAQDHSLTFDEAALYPLLENAVDLSNNISQTQPAAAQRLDASLLKSLREKPAEYRGKLLEIHGLLAMAPRTLGRMARGGAWENKLQQWVIKIGEAESDVVVVYLVDPPLPQNRPRVGEAVRCVARFFKMWDQPLYRHDDDQIVSFVTFVGRGITLDLSKKNDADSNTSWQSTPLWRLGFPALLVLMMGIYSVARLHRRALEKAKLDAQENAPKPVSFSSISTTPKTDAAPEQSPLPVDPAAALKTLAQSHKDEKS